MRATIQLHDDFRCSRSVFEALVTHPEMGRRDREPEKSLREEITHHVQHTEVGNHLHFVAIEIAGWSFDALFSPDLERYAVQTGLVGQQMCRKWSGLVEFEVPQDTGDTFDDQSVREYLERFHFRACFRPLTLKTHHALCHIEMLSFGQEPRTRERGDDPFGIQGLEAGFRGPYRFKRPSDLLGKRTDMSLTSLSKSHRLFSIPLDRFHCPVRRPAAASALARNHNRAAVCKHSGRSLDEIRSKQEKNTNCVQHWKSHQVRTVTENPPRRIDESRARTLE